MGGLFGKTPKGWAFVTEAGQLLQRTEYLTNILMDLGGTQLKTGNKIIPPYILVLVKMKVVGVVILITIMMIIIMVMILPMMMVVRCFHMMLFLMVVRHHTMSKDYCVSGKKPEYYKKALCQNWSKGRG